MRLFMELERKPPLRLFTGNTSASFDDTIIKHPVAEEKPVGKES